MDVHRSGKPTLDDQICFPLYACSKEMIRSYSPLLSPLDLTYTQYLVLMALWEKENVSVKTLGSMLYLDSGTLSPVLKKLESKGYIVRSRCPEDERSVFVTLTEKGRALQPAAAAIPEKIGGTTGLTPEETAQLHQLLKKALSCLSAISE